ncbi:MAG: anti-sigma factor [Verrucomicrobiota bacterium]
MNKEDQQGKAVQYALGTMPEDELDGFESQLCGDRELQQLVHDWQEVNEIDARECPQVDVPFGAYSSIMDQIDAAALETASDEASEGVNSIEERKVVSFWQWGGWAVAACAAVAFMAFGGPNPEQESRESLVASIVLKEMGKPGAQRLQLAEENGGREERMFKLAELAEAYWDSRSAALEGNSTGGFTVFDRKFEIGFIAVENLPERESGRSYHVWARSEGSEEAIRAGSLPVGKSSFGMFYFDISSKEGIDATDETLSFFVTEETTAEPERPEGRVVLSGI